MGLCCSHSIRCARAAGATIAWLSVTKRRYGAHADSSHCRDRLARGRSRRADAIAAWRPRPRVGASHRSRVSRAVPLMVRLPCTGLGAPIAGSRHNVGFCCGRFNRMRGRSPRYQARPSAASGVVRRTVGTARSPAALISPRWSAASSPVDAARATEARRARGLWGAGRSSSRARTPGSAVCGYPSRAPREDAGRPGRPHNVGFCCGHSNRMRGRSPRYQSVTVSSKRR